MAEKKSRRNETTDALFDAILSLESREECYAFFEDLCTVKEISDMAQRLQAAKLLLETLYTYFISHASLMSPEYLAIAEKEDVHRAVCDYISGMSDEFAIRTFEEIFVPQKWHVL